MGKRFEKALVSELDVRFGGDEPLRSAKHVA